MSSVLIELQFLPNISYFALMLQYEQVILEQQEHYEKQSFRSRAYIHGPHQIETLSVPVLNGTSKQLIRDVKIDYSQHWHIKNWRTITAAYAKAPYFEYFAPYLEKSFATKHTFLWDLNYELLTTCLKLMKFNPNFTFSETFDNQIHNDTLDARSAIHPKQKTDISSFFCPFVYQQNFGSNFVPNLSIIDLLFCKGTETKMILQKSLVN